jgi:hypothetical protein
MMRTLVTAAALVAAFGVSIGHAGAATLEEREKAVLAQPDSADRAFELAEAYRSAKELGRGVAFFSEFHKTHKPNSMSLVWQGSLKTASSASGDDMEQRLDRLQSGMADMDRAVRLFPEDRRVLLVRAVTMSHFPPVLGMQAKAIHDLESVLATGNRLSSGATASAREALARLYRDTGRASDADKLLAGQAGAVR